MAMIIADQMSNDTLPNTPTPYYQQDGTTIYHGKAEAVLPTLPSASIDLIATDPPFYRFKSEEWDRQWSTSGEYLAWLGGLCDEWRRIARPNASVYVFASPDMAPDVESEVSRRFSVLNRVRWVKRDGWHKKADQDRLRSFLSPWEEIIFAEFPVDDTVRYLRGECEAAGITPQRLSGLLGFSPTSGSIAPRRYLSVAGFAPIARDKYRELQEMTGRFARDYDELYRHFVKPTARDMTDVWDFDPVAPSVDKHPCEKPLEMMEFIILSSSRWGGSVLDSCSGSGSTLVAAKHLGRTAIGIEQDERWCEYAANRLAQGVLFGAAG